MNNNPAESIGFSTERLASLDNELYQRMQQSFIESDITGLDAQRALIEQNRQLHQELFKYQSQVAKYRAQAVICILNENNGNIRCAKSTHDAGVWLDESWKNTSLIGQMILYKFIAGLTDDLEVCCSNVPDTLTGAEKKKMAAKLHLLAVWSLKIFYPDALELARETHEQEVREAFGKAEKEAV